jgi:hypothetical protein
MTLATLPRAAQIASVVGHYPRVAASPFPILSGYQLAKPVENHFLQGDL